MKQNVIFFNKQLATSISLGKTAFRLSRTYQPARPPAAAFAACIRKSTQASGTGV